MMRRKLVALLLLLLPSALALLPSMVLPRLASAAPPSLTLAAYRAMLNEGVEHLEQAIALLDGGSAAPAAYEIQQAIRRLNGVWQVEAPAGTLTADLTDLHGLLQEAITDPVGHLPTALRLAHELVDAADGIGSAGLVTVPGARKTLDQALEQTTALSFRERIEAWFNRLLGRQVDQVAGQTVPHGTLWVAGALGAAALAWFGYSLHRMLRGHGSKEETALPSGQSRPTDPPPSPEQLRLLARSLAERGAYLEALRTDHLALLQHYDAVGLIRYQSAQTNREHEAQLRRHPDLARTLRLLHDLVDVRLYSGHGASEADYVRAHALVDQLWREGDARSKGPKTIPGRSSSALSP